MTITINLDLDMDSYNKKYGPGSEFAKKYGPQVFAPDWLEDAVKDVLSEGFYDWDSQGWMKVEVQQG
jgi:hypothetical protein